MALIDGVHGTGKRGTPGTLLCDLTLGVHSIKFAAPSREKLSIRMPAFALFDFGIRRCKDLHYEITSITPRRRPQQVTCSAFRVFKDNEKKRVMASLVLTPD